MGMGLPNPYTPELERQVRYFQRRIDADAVYPVLRVRGALKSLNRREPRNFAAAVAVTLHHPEKSPLNTTHLRHQYQCLLRSIGDIGSNHTFTACPRDRPQLLTPLNHARDSNPCASRPTPEAAKTRLSWYPATKYALRSTYLTHTTQQSRQRQQRRLLPPELIIDHEQPKAHRYLDRPQATLSSGPSTTAGTCERFLPSTLSDAPIAYPQH
ncbi:hypothetical protein CNYM01_09260 [Colletotrichum nymphaeae SA-01]|uniref:Uncharacterized protein n=1 Tax=Colletotrichum nymphaeae SA-01 TaxID=1460502 RepID=A0A135UUV5_9PEZI|nr:hypothetical protein CNYM01_09260 [Colletotrichum nymphaeae SA-01]